MGTEIVHLSSNGPQAAIRSVRGTGVTVAVTETSHKDVYVNVLVPFAMMGDSKQSLFVGDSIIAFPGATELRLFRRHEASEVFTAVVEIRMPDFG